MKERITFVLTTDENVDLKHLDVGENSVRMKSLKAAREERFTFFPHELPQETRQLLKQCHNLHLKWVSDLPYAPPAPFVSRACPGLHITVVLHLNRSPDILCPLLQKVFGHGKYCVYNEDTLIKISAAQSHHSSFPAFHYHDFSLSLRNLIIYLQLKYCSAQDFDCARAAERLEEAAYLDVDYDAKSGQVIFTSFDQRSPDPDGWNDEIQPRWNSTKTETGIFTQQQTSASEELSFAGYLTVVSEDKKPKQTRFSFPSRHHPASDSSFLVTFPKPAGLHPTLRLTFPTLVSSPAQDCGLYTHLTLPLSFFVDKYQLSSPNYLIANNLQGIRALSGETDLEAPEWVVRKWGSTMLLELVHHTPHGARLESMESKWHVNIPLHLRYLPPREGGATSVNIPWPIVFWACPAEEGMDLNDNPFDRLNLGYEALFDPATTFYHFEPQPREEGGRLMERVQVPVMDLQESGWVESGTVGVIILGALWVTWEILRVSLSGWEWRKRTSLPKKVQ